MADLEAMLPPGARMSYWIAATLVRAREEAGIHERQMAEIMGVDPSTIRRWETGDSFGRRTELDRAIAGYAYVLGLEDARELWDAALTAWYEHGSPPEFMPIEGPAAAFAEAIRTEALRQRHRQGAVRRPSRRSAKKRNAGG